MNATYHKIFMKLQLTPSSGLYDSRVDSMAMNLTDCAFFLNGRCDKVGLIAVLRRDEAAVYWSPASIGP